MSSIYRTFNHFSQSLLDPLFEVYEVLKKEDHEYYEKLLLDLDSLDWDIVDSYIKGNQIKYNIHDGGENPISKRAFFFLQEIKKDISHERLVMLKDQSERSSPYNSMNLLGLDIDKHKLISTKILGIEKMGFIKDNLVYMLCPVLEQSNSSYWITLAIQRAILKEKLSFRIRLDPFIETPIEKYSPVIYRMHIHGKPLNWERISRLRIDEFGRWLDEKNYNRIGYTDFVWSPKNDTVHFTCEELPKTDYTGIKTSRYFHAIFDKKTGGITHCDGAIRIYESDELRYRYNYHIKDAIARKMGCRIKIFQFESNDNALKQLNQDLFCYLVVNFYVWNNDLIEYFI